MHMKLTMNSCAGHLLATDATLAPCSDAPELHMRCTCEAH